MTMNFAGLTPSEVTALGGQLDVLERLILTLASISDPAKLEANARMCKQAQTEALAAMEKAAAAERSLADVTARQEQMAAELQAKTQDLETRELRLREREVQITDREQKFAELAARLRAAA
jgi:hypothetical protein